MVEDQTPSQGVQQKQVSTAQAASDQLSGSSNRRRTWLASADYAWQVLRRQLNGSPLQLGGLYLWVRRSSGKRTLSDYSEELSDTAVNRSLDLLKIRYAPSDSAEAAPANLVQALALSRRELRKRKVAHRQHGLRPLNP